MQKSPALITSDLCPRDGQNSKENIVIEFELLRDAGVLIVAPKETLTAEDFRAISSTVDPYISENGKLSGLLLEAPSFPGWDSLSTAIEHMRFVRDHHRKIERVAIVTDSTILKLAPKIAEHFAHPEFKVFKSDERANALAWLQGTDR
jgi:SpoIIAA-like